MSAKERTYIFMMDVEAAMEFYERVKYLDEDTEENRTRLLLRMAKEGKISSVSSTKRTKKQVIEDYKKNFIVRDFTNGD